MNYEEEINTLKRAGFFQDGDDAVSLIAAFESMQIERERLRKERDEARRIICLSEAAEMSYGENGVPYHPSVAHKIAEGRGWDCFLTTSYLWQG